MAKDAEITKTIGNSAATILSGTTGGKFLGDIFSVAGNAGKGIVDWAGGLFNGDYSFNYVPPPADYVAPNVEE